MRFYKNFGLFLIAFFYNNEKYFLKLRLELKRNRDFFTTNASHFKNFPTFLRQLLRWISFRIYVCGNDAKASVSKIGTFLL